MRLLRVGQVKDTAGEGWQSKEVAAPTFIQPTTLEPYPQQQSAESARWLRTSSDGCMSIISPLRCAKSSTTAPTYVSGTSTIASS